MDLVGDAITAMRAGQPRSARGRLTGSWGLRFGATGGLGVHVLIEGSAWLLPPGGGSALRLSPGDVVLVERGRTHGLADDPSTPLVDVAFSEAGQQGYWQREKDIPAGAIPAVFIGGSYYLDKIRPHPLITNLPPVLHLPAQLSSDAVVSIVVDLLRAEIGSDRPGGTAAIPALLDLLLIYAVRTWYQRADLHDGWAEALRDPGIREALRAIQEHCEEQWTVEELARLAGMSRAAFARRFASLIGQPPLTYLTWWRMTRAAQLLKDTTAPLRTIAAKVGYVSEFTFSRAFKRDFGSSPGSYRRDQHAVTPP